MELDTNPTKPTKYVRLIRSPNYRELTLYIYIHPCVSDYMPLPECITTLPRYPLGYPSGGSTVVVTRNKPVTWWFIAT